VSSSKELSDTHDLVSSRRVLSDTLGLVSSPKELSDTLDLARSLKTIRKGRQHRRYKSTHRMNLASACSPILAFWILAKKKVRRCKLLKKLKVRRQKCSVSSPQELRNTPCLASGSKELSDTLDLAHSSRELSDTLPCLLDFQDCQEKHRQHLRAAESVPVLQKDLKELLVSLVLILYQEKELEIVKEPSQPIVTSTPSSSPTNPPPPLPPRRCQSSPPRTRSCSPSCSDVRLIQGEVFTDSELFSPKKGREAIKSSNTRRCLASSVDPPAPSSQNCSTDAILVAETSIEVIATMDWREAEKAVVKKCKKLETKLKRYTPNDIDAKYDEVEFNKELEVMKEAFCEADESIGELLCDYGDSMPTQQKEHWTRQATEILQLMKSHERKLRDAISRAKGNITAPASNTSELARAKRKEALSKMKTHEESIASDASKLQDKIYRVRD